MKLWKFSLAWAALLSLMGLLCLPAHSQLIESKVNGQTVLTPVYPFFNTRFYGLTAGPVGVDAAGNLVPGGPSTYLGLVATRGQLADFVTTANTWSMTRTVHVARTAIPAGGLKLWFPNWYVPAGQTSVETNPGPATYKASIEYPPGTMTLCTWSFMSVSPSIAGLADAVTDWCGPAIPNGAQFFVRTLRISSANVIAMNLNVQSTVDGSLFGTGTPNDETMSGAGPVGGDYIYGPSAIIGLTDKPSVCITGDSRATGVADAASDFTNDMGEIARIIGPALAYTKLSIPGDTITNAVNNYTARSRLFALCSHVIDEYGVNDKDVLGTSDAALVGLRTQLAVMSGKPVYGSTIPNETTSTDNWATTTNQTISGLDVRPFNLLVRAGIPSEVGVIDVAKAVDPALIGKWPVSPIAGTSTGSANYATPDGIHETNTMNSYVAGVLGYVARWFSR